MADELKIEDVLKAMRMGVADTSIKGLRLSRAELKLITDHVASLQEYKTWYDEAMEATNRAGYAGMSAAQVIDDMAYGLKQLEDKSGD